MKVTANTAKWTGKWILQVPVCIVTSYVIRMLIGTCYKLLLRGGANVPPNYLMHHFLWIGLISGGLAGLFGVLVVRAALLLPLHITGVTGHPWLRPQAWTWVLPTCWLLYGIKAYSQSHAFHSVLATRPQDTGLLAAFFGSGCDLAGTGNLIEMIRFCTYQLRFTEIWLEALGYSAAAFIVADWFRTLHGSRLSEFEVTRPEQSEQSAEQSRA